MKIRVECGQKWYSISSWRRCGFRRRNLTQPTGYLKDWQRIHIGWAIGPIMFFKKGIDI